jgi:Flp pilus assembly protein TadD
MTKIFVLLTSENTMGLWNNKGIALDKLGRKEKNA